MRGHDRQARRRTARAKSRRVQVEMLESRCLLSGANPFQIISINPANGSVVPGLPSSGPVYTFPPSGEITVTLSEPVAGLTNGQSPLQSSGTFNPYDVMLIPRGPSGVFSAPSGVNGGSQPLRVSVIYHVNSDGTSEFVIRPAEGLVNDVYGVSIDLSAFKDASGNTLTDANNGFSTFLLRVPSGNPNQPLTVERVAAFGGKTTIDNNVIPTPDTIQIEFNKGLYIGAAQGNNVQLIANPGPHFSVVPSVAVYQPRYGSIFLTPTAALSPGTVYAVRVAGQDSGGSYVSDDQGYGGSGYPLAHTFYDTFEVSAGSANIPAGPLRVGAIAPNPQMDGLSYLAIQLTEPLDVSSLGRDSAVLIPSAGGYGSTDFGAGTAPLNAVVAYNPNTLQLIIVPTQDFDSDDYLLSLSGLKATNGNPLVNNAGQPAGVNGNPPYYALFPIAFIEPLAAPAVSGQVESATAPVVLATIPDPAAASNRS